MLSILDKNTGGQIDSFGGGSSAIKDGVLRFDDKERKNLFDFKVLNKYAENFQNRNTLIVADEFKELHEFIITKVVEGQHFKEVYANDAYGEHLRKGKPILRGSYTGTMREHALMALTDTGYELGQFDYGGVKTISHQDTNPLAYLIMIANNYDKVLKFTVEASGGRIVRRFVHILDKQRIFDGAEINSKSLEKVSRTEDTEDLVTALIAVGPENDDGERVELEVKDEEAQRQWGLPGRYLWDIYSPETEDQDMTEARLRTLARTELRKRIENNLEYAVEARNLDRSLNYSEARNGHTVRVKAEEFNPPIYVEMDITAREMDYPGYKNKRLEFGQIIEYTREELEDRINAIVSRLRDSLKDAKGNLEDIRIEIDNADLENIERKIIKQDTPPADPANNQLWLDTSKEPEILYRWSGGEWKKAQPTKPEEVGAISREKAMYDNLETIVNDLYHNHAETVARITGMLNSPYFIDGDNKTELNARLVDMEAVYNEVVEAFNTLDRNTAGYPQLSNVFSLISNYRAMLKPLAEIVDVSQKQIDEHFRVLQSQYSDKKFNDALEEVAKKWGLTVTDGQLVGGVVTPTEYNELIGKYEENKAEIEAARTDAQNRLESAKGELIDMMDAINVDARNLIIGTPLNDTDKFTLYGTTKEIRQDEPIDYVRLANGSGWAGVTFHNDVNYTAGRVYTFSHDFRSGSVNDLDKIEIIQPDGTTKDITNELQPVSGSITANGDWGTYFYEWTPGADITGALRVAAASPAGSFDLRNIKMVDGDIRTPWTPAPEDNAQFITQLSREITEVEGLLSSKLEQKDIDPINGQIDTINSEIKQVNNAISLLASQESVDALAGTVEEMDAEVTANAQEILLRATKTEVQTVADDLENLEIDARNLFIMDDVVNLAISGNIVESSSYRGYYIPVKPGEKYNISRGSLEVPNRFRYVFTEMEPAPGVEYFGGTGNSSSSESKLSHENIVVPEGANFLFIYLSNENEDITAEMSIMLQKGDRVTEWSLAPEDIERRVTETEATLKVESDRIKELVTFRESTENRLETAEAERVTMSKQIADRVKTTDYELDKQGIISDIETAQAERVTMSNQIADRVTKTTYNNKMSEIDGELQTQANKISTAEAERVTMSNKIADRVTTTTYNNKMSEVDGKLKTHGQEIETAKAERVTMSNQIADRVKTADYTTDKNGIIRRLETGEAERVTMSGQISDRVTITTYNDYKLATGTEDDARISKVIPETESGKWLRVASNGGSRAHGRFIISDQTSGQHGTAEIIAGINYGRISKAELVLNGFAEYGNFPFTKARILAGGTYDDMYLDLYFTTGRAASVKIWLKENIQSAGWTLQEFTDATVPSGYTAKELELSRETSTSGVIEKHESEISQNGSDILQRAKITEMNAQDKTLSQTIAEVITSAVDGISLSYDNNGVIQSFDLDSDGGRLNVSKFDINDGDVIIQNGRTTIKNAYIDRLSNDTAFIDKLTGRTAFINNVKAIDIDFDRATARGGSTTSSLKLSGDEIMLRGNFNRTWKGVTENHDTYTRMRNGHLRFRNNTYDRSLYYSDFGISTYIDGEGDYTASGTLQFFDYTYGDARGVTLESNLGVVALRSNENRIVLEADDTVNLESKKYSVYIRPFMNTRSGVNEFQFYVKDNSSGWNTDGTILYGSLTEGAGTGSGIRFRKDGRDRPTVYATNSNGDIGTGDFDADQFWGTGFGAKTTNLYAMVADGGELRVTDKRGYNGGSTYYEDIRAKEIKTNSGLYSSHTSGNTYMGVATGEFRVTDNNHYNSGNTTYRDIRFRNWRAMSHEKYKYDIRKWNMNVLNIFKEELQLYSFKVKGELETENSLIHQGIVIRENSVEDRFPAEWREGDGFNGNKVLWWTVKGVQEAAYKIDDIFDIIKGQQNKIDDLEKTVSEQKSEMEIMKDELTQIKEMINYDKRNKRK